MTPDRLLIVSNRLPTTVSVDDDGRLGLEPSPGGLATGLRTVHARTSGLWIGWPGQARLGARKASELRSLLERERLVPVELSSEEVRRYYEGFSNRVIWPLFHYFLDRVPLDEHEWQTYETVNRKFAEAVLKHASDRDVIWVHDYQLMLVPRLLRERLPDARIGFFLHIPFPTFEVFRLLPWRRRILTGLLGADLIGVHTESYAAHCIEALEHLMHLDFDGTTADFLGRQVQVRAFPMGIDGARFAERADSEAVAERLAGLRTEADSRRLLVGVDRLDYTKGIPRRLLAFERLLTRRPEWRDSVRMIQVAVPSRTAVEDYRAFQRRVNELVGRINGGKGTVTTVPLHYLHRSIDEDDLVALYRAADVMVVTPLRDGMNLVAKEFVASRTDDDGVLLLSEFAGAADELREALIVNPYDIDIVAGAMERGLTMPATERTIRMRALRRHVMGSTVHAWVEAFLEALKASSHRADAVATPWPTIAGLIKELEASAPLTLLIDYDGTLVSLAELPELASPDAALGPLLRALASKPGRQVHVVSGRPRETLERWLGDLPITLWGEHALWRRQAETGDWRALARPGRSWKQPVRALMDQYVVSNPGAFVEDKGDSLAWHYRQCDAVTGREAARALCAEIGSAPVAEPIETVSGNKVLEVRPKGVHKGLAVQALAQERPEAAIVAIGDDRTDEDMFAALPSSGLAIKVGAGESRASHRIGTPSDLRRLLGALVDGDTRPADPI